MTSRFSKWLAFWQNRSKKQSVKRGVWRRRFIPEIEILEARTLLSANGFLQGTAFLDANGDKTFDPSDQGLAGATINLYQGTSATGTPYATTTTDSHGNYSFSNLAPGSYTLVETPPTGYYNDGTQALSQLNPATGVGDNSIQVTIADPSSVYANFNGFNSNYQVVYDSINGTADANSVGQMQFSLGTAAGKADLNSGYISFCVDDLHTLSSFTGPDDYQVLPSPIASLSNGTSTISPDQAGRIAYLFNHYGQASLNADQAAGLQLAIWALLYDTPIPTNFTASDFSSGNFQVTGPYPPYTNSTDLATAETDAANYINESVGHDETAIFLDYTMGGQSVPLVGGQGLLATGSYDFGNVLKATPSINTSQQPATATVGSSIADKATVTGLVNASGSDTVTFNLYNSATTQNSSTLLYTDTETVSLSGGTATATSKGYTATATGTDYWVATFNGDSNNNAVTSTATAEPVSITPSTPSINTNQQPASATVGSSIADKATVTGLVNASSSDTVTFNLYSSATTQNSSTLLYSDTETVSLSGSTATATSKGYTAAATGTDYWVATFNGDTNNNAVTSTATAEPVTITPATPSINTSQQPASATVGSSIADKATVTGLVNASSSDTVTFNLYSSATTQNSSTLLYSDTETVSLSGSTATATSKGYTATATGTDYWVATFNGDTNNNAVTSGATDEPVAITPATPSINTSQQPASATVGSSIADKATVTGLVSASSSDTVTFSLYSSATTQNSSTLLYSDTETVSLSGGTATATSKGYTATATGTDYWVATFNGDSNNKAVTSTATGEPVTITPATPSINTSQQPASATVGSSIADKATVTGLVNASSSDTVTFDLYSSATTQNSTTLLYSDSETVSLSGSTATATSKGYTSAATGTDYWVATFNGDSNNNTVTSGATDEPVSITPATPSINTSQQPASATVGSSIADKATVTGLVDASSSDTVTFNLYSSATTQNAGTLLYTDTETVSLSGGTATATSKGYTATATGTDYWVATFNGDSNNKAVTSGSADEPVSITPATPSINTSQQPASATVGSSIADKATVSGLVNASSGDTVTFNLYNSATTQNSSTLLYTDTETVSLSGGTATATSKGYISVATGTDYWVATFNGDSNNKAVTSGATDEPVSITPSTPSINTSQQPASATVGISIADKATVTGLVDASSGDTVTFNLYSSATTQNSSTLLYSDTETVSLSGGTATATSKGYTATATGTDYWVATFNGDSNNKAVTSGATDEPVTITPPPQISVVKTADQAQITGGQSAGFTVTITNNGTVTDTGVTLSDPLPSAGANGDIFWTIDTGKDNPSDFAITGSKGSQSLVLSSSFLNGGDSLAAGQSIAVHITSPTDAADGNGDTAAPANSFDPTDTAAAGLVSLGTAGNYAVLGLANTKINNSLVTVNGNEGVSQGGSLTNMAPSTITGNVYQYASGQYSGPGVLDGSVITDSSLLSQNDSDALAVSAAAKALTATQTFNGISTATTIHGNGGLNVIDINGNVNLGGSNSLMLDGTASDVFIVNISGSLSINGSAQLGLSGGVTANHVLYNFTGSSGTISAQVGNVWYGTILAPHYSYTLDGTYYGELIAGGSNITLMSGVKVIAGGKLPNTATVSATGVPPQQSSATITITPAGASITTTPGGTVQLGNINISGTKSLDLTGNGFSADDKTQSGVTIDLYLDTLGTGVLDTSKDTLVATTTTGSNGTYSFTVNAAGTYFVQEVVPSGYVQTGGGPNGSAGNTYYTIVAKSGYNYSGYDFDDFQVPTCQPSSFCYQVTTPNGCSNWVSSLSGNTQQGDTVTVWFDVPSGMNDTLTLVSYVAPTPSWDSSTAHEQQIYQQASGTFGSGWHSLTVKIPNTYYQIDFVCGQAINQLEPNQNGNAYGPDSGEILYHAEDRFIDSDSGGWCAPSSSSLNWSTPTVPTPTQTQAAGAKLTDSATLSAGNNPTGTITFYLFAPGVTPNATDSNAVYSDTVTVNGDGTYTTSSGTNPGGYLPTAAGTYQWVAVYSGDNNNGSVSDTFGSEPETVTGATPSLTTTPGGTVQLGNITISGTKYLDLTGNGFSSDDTHQSGVTIDLYLDTQGTGVLDTSKDTLVATTTTGSNGTYSFTVNAAGTYFVQEAVPSGYVQTGGGPNGSAGNTYYTIVAKSGYNYSGYDFDDYQVPTCKPDCISYEVTTPNGCSQWVSSLSGNTQQGDTVTVWFDVPSGMNDTLTLVSYIAPTPSWDSSTAHEQQIYQQASGTFGSGWHSLTVKIPNTYYQIDFVCGQAINQLEPNQNGNAYGPDSGEILYHAEDRFIDSDSGGWCAPSSSSLNWSTPQTPTPTQTVGATLTDSATLSGGNNPTGTITFYLFAPGVTPSATDSNAVYSDTVTVNGDGTYTTSSGTNPGGYLPTAAGTYQWVAVYSGDSKNSSVSDTFGNEPEKVNGVSPTITTTAGPSVVLDSNGALTDSATLSGGYNPTGAITFYLFAPGVTPNATDSNAAYSNTVAVNGNGTYSTSTGFVPAVTGTFEWVAVYSGDNNNSSVASCFGDEPEAVTAPGNNVSEGEFATIGFWHNCNGQAVIKSFNGGSSAKNLGNWLATNFPNLFGASNPYISGSLAGLTNAQIATVYEDLWTPSGVAKNTYVQSFAIALGVYADTSSLSGTNTLASQYGFKVTSSGFGGATYNVGSNGAAFGVANNSSLTVMQALSAADANFDAALGTFYNGNQNQQTLTSELNNVLNGINTQGDI